MIVKEKIVQAIENLDEGQLQKLAEFIALLEVKKECIKEEKEIKKYASLYAEFAEEDRQIAEEGMSHYTELLQLEDCL